MDVVKPKTQEERIAERRQRIQQKKQTIHNKTANNLPNNNNNSSTNNNNTDESNSILVSKQTIAVSRRTIDEAKEAALDSVSDVSIARNYNEQNRRTKEKKNYNETIVKIENELEHSRKVNKEIE